jgi:hypothetical protein
MWVYILPSLNTLSSKNEFARVQELMGFYRLQSHLTIFRHELNVTEF